MHIYYFCFIVDTMSYNLLMILDFNVFSYPTRAGLNIKKFELWRRNAERENKSKRGSMADAKCCTCSSVQHFVLYKENADDDDGPSW